MSETHDPFVVLRATTDGSNPSAPRPSFVAALRARLELVLTPTIELPERSATVTDTAASTTQAPPVAITATQTLTPYLTVHNGVEALDWYTRAMGAIEVTRFSGDDGRIGHAELRIGTATFFLSDEYPEIGVVSPRTLGGTPFALHLDVVETDYAYQRAVEAGATSLSAPEDKPHGARSATILDPYGHRWMLSQAISGPTPEAIMAADPSFTVTGRVPSEPGYITMHMADQVKAATFFGELFGWMFEPGGHIKNTRFPMGMTSPSTDNRDVKLYFRVDNIDSYAARVVELGGQVLGTTEYDSGGNAECVDDQGFRFDLFRPAPGY